MNLAALSLAALVVALAMSFGTRLNVGVLSMAFAWVIGVYLGHMGLAEVLAGFPTQLFLTLAGVTLLFAHAQANGTLDCIAHHAVRSCRGNTGLIPILFFVLAAGLASIGPGNIAMAALLAPLALQVAGRAGIPAFLMILMVGNGANAGALSPIAPTGIIVNGLMAKIGLAGHEWPTYLAVLLAHAAVGFAGYFAFGGWRLFRRSYADSAGDASAFERRHLVTLAVIAALVSAVMLFKINVGMGALAGVVVLALFRATAGEDAVKRMPWNTILMVCGVTVLIALLEKTQGMDLFVSLLARVSTPRSVTAVVAFVTGLISVYSSTSGVVLPAFLPTAPGLAATLGGDPLSIAWSMCVGGHLVDVSPLSTIGALCIASASLAEDHRALFNKLLAWGLSMSVVGAALCWLFFGVLQ